MHSFIQKAFTEYLMQARIEPGSEYTQVIPTPANLNIVCNGMPWRI